MQKNRFFTNIFADWFLDKLDNGYSIFTPYCQLIHGRVSRKWRYTTNYWPIYGLKNPSGGRWIFLVREIELIRDVGKNTSWGNKLLFCYIFWLSIKKMFCTFHTYNTKRQLYCVFTIWLQQIYCLQNVWKLRVIHSKQCARGIDVMIFFAIFTPLHTKIEKKLFLLGINSKYEY